MQTLRTKWDNWMSHAVKTLQKNKQQVGVIFVALGVFSLSWYAILRVNFFYTGDVGIIGLIASDILNGDWHSWYYYGQNYLGNLWPIVLAGGGLITGLSFETIAFWEHVQFLIATIALALTIRWRTYLLAVPFFIILFYPFAYRLFTFNMSFSLNVAIIGVLFYVFDRIWQTWQQPPVWVVGMMGVFFGLSVWHNPIYIFIPPIFGAYMVYQHFFAHHKITLAQIVGGFVGLLIGSIPLVLGTLEKSGANLTWYTENSGSGSLRDSIVYYAQETVFLFVPQDLIRPIVDNYRFTEPKFILSVLEDPRIVLGLFLFAISAVTIAYGMLRWRTYGLHILFCACLFILIVVRGAEGANGLYTLIRYSYPFHVLWVALVLRIVIDSISASNQILKTTAISIFAVLSVVLTANATQVILQSVTNPHQGLIIYEQMYQDLQEVDAQYVYCYDYYRVCGQLLFLAATEKNAITIDYFEEVLAKGSERNPTTDGKVGQAVQEGKQVYSLIYEAMVPYVDRDTTFLEKYYYQGSFVYYLIDTPFICAPNAAHTEVDPDSGRPWKKCSEIVAEFANRDSNEKYIVETVSGL